MGVAVPSEGAPKMHGHMSYAAMLLIGIATPACMLVVGSLILFLRRRCVGSLLQLVGAVCLLVMASTHVSEALGLFPWMGWGLPNSSGHYIDLLSALLGLSLFPLGYLSFALTDRE